LASLQRLVPAREWRETPGAPCQCSSRVRKRFEMRLQIDRVRASTCDQRGGGLPVTLTGELNQLRRGRWREAIPGAKANIPTS
jgi:hypothetical protein